MRFFPLLLLASGLLPAQNNSLSVAEARSGWILLFDGESMFGWAPEGGATWAVSNGTLTSTGESGWLRTNSAFADFVLTCEFRVGLNGESGIFLRTDAQGDPLEKGYKIQLGDMNAEFPTGSIVKYLKARPGRLSPDQWHRLEVEADADRFIVRLDGNEVLNDTDSKHNAGHIGLEYRKGFPVQFRNIKLRPLNLKNLFNGRDLDGWSAEAPPQKKPGSSPIGKLRKILAPPKPNEAPVWTVENGAIRAQKGAGRLQTLAAYDDFILQIEIRTRSQSLKTFPKTGVRFRQDPKVWETGYESHKLHSSRPVNNIRDNEFFLETLAVRGRQMAVWIDGKRIIDYYDSRAEAPDVAQGARTAPGPIALETLDPGVSPEFRSIRIAGFPRPAAQPPKSVISATQTPPGITPPPLPVHEASPVSVVPGLPLPLPLPAAPPMPGQPAPDPRQAQVSKLMNQALNTNDPEEQAKIYKQILSIESTNLVANTNLKDAEGKIQKAKTDAQQLRTQEAEQRAVQAKRNEQQRANETTRQQMVAKAEAAIISGDLQSAAAALAIAKRLSPADADVMRLDSLVQNRIQSRNRIRLVVGAGGLAALLGLAALVFRKRGRKEPYLELLDGMYKGQRFGLDKDIIHIGTIAEDGGSRNDIVITDPERKISRFHCQIHRRDNKLFLLDCKSANGTYLNRKRVQSGEYRRLKNGSRVELAGTCTLRVGFERRKEQK